MEYPPCSSSPKVVGEVSTLSRSQILPPRAPPNPSVNVTRSGMPLRVTLPRTLGVKGAVEIEPARSTTEGHSRR
jgi:hypothetical protein